eukprot:TRINITY_DN4513_c0_g1_i2.p1 TRINITY_DN4513_c0_g1~~TRINITY_DN4513_c0_g1_i2.p1  ORF type:complete len:147 (-),score=22.94 TRINITY_DN4513_c0_g1_i2:71-511(-)
MHETTSLSGATRYYDLCGYWLADFAKNGLELMQIVEDSTTFIARKITGDANVPANEISFIVDKKSLIGKIQVAERGYVNPQWMPGRIDNPTDPCFFTFTWSDPHLTFNVHRKFTRVLVSSDDDILNLQYYSVYSCIDGNDPPRIPK